MKLTVNGERYDAADGITVAALITEIGAADRRVAVMVNDRIVPGHLRDTTPLCAGDRVDILSLVAGG